MKMSSIHSNNKIYYDILEEIIDQIQRRLKTSPIKLDIFVNDMTSVAVAPLLSCIRPEWDVHYIKFKVFHDGHTNASAAFFMRSVNDDDAVVVRINGHGTEKFICRQQEILSFRRLSHAGLCPPLEAVFRNGIVMSFIHGAALTLDNVTNPRVARTTAREIAKMHRDVRLNKTECADSFHTVIDNYMTHIPDRYSKASVRQRQTQLSTPDKSTLNAELKYAARLLRKQSSPLVLCHNDLLLNNFLYEADCDKIHIIDYECLAANPAAFDIANHFQEYGSPHSNNGKSDYTRVPADKYQRWWITQYLTTYFKRRVAKDEVIEFHHSVRLMAPLSHLLQGVWSLMQAEISAINFDYINYAKIRLDQYFILKSQLTVN